MASGPQPQGHFLVAAREDCLFVRVVGLATLSSSAPLQEAIEGTRRGGHFRRFIFDLADCSGFDSTFMGILLGAATATGDGETGRRAVVLVNARAEHVRLLAEVGMDRVVHLRAEPLEFPPVELRKLDDRPPDPAARIRTLVAAHENLVQLGGPNIEKFGAMLDALKRELGGDALLRK